MKSLKFVLGYALAAVSTACRKLDADTANSIAAVNLLESAKAGLYITLDGEDKVTLTPYGLLQADTATQLLAVSIVRVLEGNPAAGQSQEVQQLIHKITELSTNIKYPEPTEDAEYTEVPTRDGSIPEGVPAAPTPTKKGKKAK